MGLKNLTNGFVKKINQFYEDEEDLAELSNFKTVEAPYIKDEDDAQNQENKSKYTLILDLDETLLHF